MRDEETITSIPHTIAGGIVLREKEKDLRYARMSCSQSRSASHQQPLLHLVCEDGRPVLRSFPDALWRCGWVTYGWRGVGDLRFNGAVGSFMDGDYTVTYPHAQSYSQHVDAVHTGFGQQGPHSRVCRTKCKPLPSIVPSEPGQWVKQRIANSAVVHGRRFGDRR
jgi:hypothetical protein